MTVSPTEHMWEIATRAVVSDEDLGYPSELSFLASDLPRWEDMLWRDLTEERRAAVVIDANALETMFIPIERSFPLRLLDRIRHSVPVRICWRQGLGTPHGDVRVNLNRAGLAAMNLGGKPAH